MVTINDFEKTTIDGKKKVICPKCGQPYSPRGILLHYPNCHGSKKIASSIAKNSNDELNSKNNDENSNEKNNQGDDMKNESNNDNNEQVELPEPTRRQRAKFFVEDHKKGIVWTGLVIGLITIIVLILTRKSTQSLSSKSLGDIAKEVEEGGKAIHGDITSKLTEAKSTTELSVSNLESDIKKSLDEMSSRLKNNPGGGFIEHEEGMIEPTKPGEFKAPPGDNRLYDIEHKHARAPTGEGYLDFIEPEEED